MRPKFSCPRYPQELAGFLRSDLHALAVVVGPSEFRILAARMAVLRTRIIAVCMPAGQLR